MNVWPFLISRSRTLGFSVIVAPQFLEDQQLSSVLLEAAGGDLTQLGQAIYREIHGTRGALSLVFRVVRAEQSLVGDGSDLLRDKYGRPINLVEGIILEGKTPDILVRDEDFQRAHEQIVPAYREFWELTKDISAVVRPATPFSLSTNSAKSAPLILTREPPFVFGKVIHSSEVDLNDEINEQPTVSIQPDQVEAKTEGTSQKKYFRSRRIVLPVLIVVLLISFIAVLFPGLLFLHGPSSPTASPTVSSNCRSGSITFGGSTALKPLASQAAQSYHTMCPQASISVNQSVASSEDGLSEVEAGHIQIGNSDLRSSKVDLVDHPVAVVIYVLIVNRDVAGITSLTTSQIQEIYNGSITNWQQVGGANLPIYVVSRTSTSGTRSVFEKYILDGQEKLPLSPTHIEVDTTDIVARTVANTAGAIGYVDLGTATKQNLPTVQIDRIKATSENVKGGSYMFWTVEHMYTKGNPSGLTNAFLDYMTGDQVRGIIENLSYLPFNDVPSNIINAHPSPIAPGGL